MTTQRPEADVDPLCELAAGHLDRFAGLPPVTRDALPACLRATDETRALAINDATLIGRAYRTAAGDVMTIFATAAHPRVVLVELAPSPGWAADALAALPAPELRVPYDRRLQDQQGLAAAGDVAVDEEVFAARGLALLYVRIADRTELRRVRGFMPTTAAAYRDRFARIPPITPLP